MRQPLPWASVLAAIIVAASVLAFASVSRADTSTPSASPTSPTPTPVPVITSDIAILMNDAYGLGESASIAIRNDGAVPYKYSAYQEACSLTYSDATGRRFQIPPATHCDLPQETEIAPGQTVTVLSKWGLDECTLPGFFCFGARPLPTGQYTIAGSLRSVDGSRRAEFSKTISVTGPQFTSDIQLLLGVAIIIDPAPPGGSPVIIALRNDGPTSYTLPRDAECYLVFTPPAGNIFTIPPASHCDINATGVISPGETVNVIGSWNRDECTEFGADGCLQSEPLPAGDYVISGALWSVDKQKYAEFSKTLTIAAATSSGSNSGATMLPNLGGPPDGSDDQGWWLMATGLVTVWAGTVMLAIARRRAGQ